MARGISATSSTTARRRARSSADARESKGERVDDPGRAPSVVESSVSLDRHAVDLDAESLRLTVGVVQDAEGHREMKHVGAVRSRGGHDPFVGPRVMEHDPFRGAEGAGSGAHTER